MKKFGKSIIGIALALTMTVMLFSATAWAANTDPNMTAYNGLFTVTVNTATTTFPATANLQVVPADANFTATYFNTTAGATGVQWSLVGATGGLIVSTPLNAPTALESDIDEYYSNLAVNIPSGAGAGAASFLAKNPNSQPSSNASVNITVIVTDGSNADSSGTTVGNVEYRFYDPVVATPFSGTLAAVSAAQSADNRSYVTVLDGVGQSTVTPNNIIASYAASGGYLSSITFNSSNTYTNNFSTNEGWQYRVYDWTGSAYALNPVSEQLGAGDYGLSSGQMVMWQYGAYGGVTFPDTTT